MVKKTKIQKIMEAINFFSPISVLFYVVFSWTIQSGSNQALYVLILSFATGSSFLFDAVNSITVVLSAIIGGLFFKFLAMFLSLDILWQYGAILGAFIVLTCQLKQMLNQHHCLQHKISMYLTSASINCILFFGLFIWRPYF